MPIHRSVRSCLKVSCKTKNHLKAGEGQNLGFLIVKKRKSPTVYVWLGARDRKFWWEHLLHIFACMHTYYNLCVRDIPLLEQKNHTIFMYQKKKDKKQLVRKGWTLSC